MSSANNKIQNIALEFLRQGIPTVPMDISYEKEGDLKAKKVALRKWGEFQTKLPSEVETTENFRNPDAQISIVCGKISGIVIIDIDIGASQENIDFLNTFSTLRVKTPSGGFHLYFKYPENIEKIKSGDYMFGPGSHIDIKADGGLATIPPSKYPNGIEYEWEGEKFDRSKIAKLPEEILKMLIEKNKPVKSEEKRQNLAHIIKGVSTGSRNMDMTSVIGTFLKRFDVSEWEDIVFPAFYAINQQNNPPLSLGELRTIYESISSKELSSRNNTEKRIEGIGNSMSLKELLGTTFPKVRFAVESLFETGTINMLSAPPNSWKSWIILLCSVCLASGKQLFDKFETSKQGVLIVNEEDTAPMLQERLSMIMEETQDLPIYFYINKEIRLEEKFIEKVVEEAKNKQVGFIIFDSLRSVHDADENSSKEMQETMNQLKKLIKEGFTVLFTHHHRKKMKGGKKDNSGEDSRGSSAINAAIHGHISCEEWDDDNKKYLIISQPKLKSDKKIDPFDVLIEIAEDKSKIKFTYSGEHKSGVKELNQTQEKVLDIVTNGDKWLSRKDLISMGIGSETTIALVTRNLEKSGYIQSKKRSEIKKMGQPVNSEEGAHNESLYFRVTEEEEAEQAFENF